MRVLIVSEGKHELGGAVQAFVVRLAASRVLDCGRGEFNDSHIHVHPGKGGRLFKRAVRWIRKADEEGYEAAVVVIDQDGDAERTKQINRAQETALSSLPRALGVAIRSFDAWMLADERALTDVLGNQVQQQPEPERIVDPKEACEALLRDSPNTMRQREMYAAVARVANLDTLEERCPNGFRPFAQRVKAL